ncbi:MAG: hypothetical protein K2Y05_06660 [Hyphomicrobiaceae bacterium]|nr:hypothetical protein [Hyphomicrobiaceae bacterium]
MPTVDTNGTIRFQASPWKLALLVGGSAAFVAIGVFMVAAQTESSRHSVEVIHVVGYLSIVFFGACGAVGLWRMLTGIGRPVLTLSPAGLRDIRVSDDTIPWSSVERIFEWSYSGSRIMIVCLHPGEEAKLPLTTIARMSRRANAGLGADGLAINASDLTIKHDDLMATTIAYAQRYGTAGTGI